MWRKFLHSLKHSAEESDPPPGQKKQKSRAEIWQWKYYKMCIADYYQVSWVTVSFKIFWLPVHEKINWITFIKHGENS